MKINRLDNKYVPLSGKTDTTPTVNVTNSYAKFSPGALAAMELTGGESFVGFGFDAETKQYVFWKAEDAKTGKKLDAYGSTKAEAIYKRLDAGSSYLLSEPVMENGVKYFSLTKQEKAEAEVAAPSSNATLSEEAYEAKYGNNTETPKVDVPTADIESFI